MTVEIDLEHPDAYYVGIWFLGSDGEGRDWLGVLHRDLEKKCLRLDYRFRYYADPDETKGFNPFDADDQKSNWSALIPADKTEDEAIEIVDGIIDTLVGQGFCGTKLPWKVRGMRHKNLVRGDGKRFKDMLMSLPYVHITTDPNAYKEKR